jgi:ADP-ribose pyrophosphatase YjhB (NUDIX family)
MRGPGKLEAMGMLECGQRLQAIAQAGLTYSREPYDRERYAQIQQIAFEMLAHRSGGTVEEAAQAFSLEAGYPTPKVDVRAVVFDDTGRLLLVHERSSGQWTLPGGWADIGDTPSAMAVRETKEEAGVDVKAVKLLAVFDKSRHGHPPSLFYVYKFFIRCEHVAGTPHGSHETIDARFFGRDELPSLDAERVTAAQVERMFVHRDRPELPTDFD